MRLEGLHIYEVEVETKGAYRVRRNDRIEKFMKPLTEKNTPKLYVFLRKDKLLYIGQTIQSMSRRLYMGFHAKGRKGYHGYKCVNAEKPTRFLLYIWTIEGLSQEKTEKNKELESIESEVVFLWRRTKGQWPESQTEIHFHESKEKHRQLAKEIIKRISMRHRKQ